jgi:hypothetical protein
MLTERQREMTPLLRRLKRQIGADGDFRSFTEKVGVEEVIKAFAAGAGIDGCALLREWSGFPGEVKTPKKRTPAMPPTMPPPMDEDDEDSPPVMPDHDDSDDDEQTTQVCPTCRGTGRDHSGRTCATCGGSGRIPLDDGDDDEEEEE